MKIQLILMSLLLLGIVNGASIEKTMVVGDTFEFQGKNITLIGISIDKDKVSICVNGEQKIIYPDDEFQGVDFKLRKIKEAYVELRALVDCNNCKCTGNECSNEKCFGLISEFNNTLNQDNNLNNNQGQSNQTINTNNTGNLNEVKSISWIYYVSFSLILIVIVLLIFVLLNKKTSEESVTKKEKKTPIKSSKKKR
ncbi:hypothetical protein J4405_03560 [Candidatus Woesearchaeota archaeon]|nr:hypothetical protein [Candidatus Woesearchaeota archaeon]